MSSSIESFADDSVAQPLSELSQERVWGMLESAPDAMLMTDEHGTILAVNAQVERIFGYDRADLLGRAVEVLLPERLRDVHRADRIRYRAAPSVRSMGAGLDLRGRRSDGSEFPVEVSLSPLRDDDGLAVVASIRDVTEQRGVSAHSDRIQAAIDAVHDGVFMFEHDSLRFVYVNDGAVAQTGYTSEELLTMTPLHIKPEFTTDEFEALLEPLATGAVKRQSFRTVHRRKDGRDVPVDIVLERRPPDSGPTMMTALVRDVTDRVEIERRLERSERTFRTSFENAPVGMALSRLAPDGSRLIERVNEAFAHMLGYVPQQLVGLDFAALTHPDDNDSSERAAAEMADGVRHSFDTEKRYRRADGSYVWALLHASVVDQSDGAVSLAHVIDITDRREREAERERLRTMEDRDRIARDLHDLIIQRLFAAGMKLQSVAPDISSETVAERVHETIDDLDATIRDLRTTIFALHERQPAVSVVDEIRRSAQTTASTLGFEPVVDATRTVNTLPPDVAEQLLATLSEALSNVARHAEASSACVQASVEDGTVVLRVTDDGAGIRTPDVSGNGLINMAERAERLGGTCDVSPNEPHGTIVTWSAPVGPLPRH